MIYKKFGFVLILISHMATLRTNLSGRSLTCNGETPPYTTVCFSTNSCCSSYSHPVALHFSGTAIGRASGSSIVLTSIPVLSQSHSDTI